MKKNIKNFETQKTEIDSELSNFYRHFAYYYYFDRFEVKAVLQKSPPSLDRSISTPFEDIRTS